MEGINWTLILIGAAGGAIPDVIRVIQGRYKEKLPNYLRKPNFWLGLILLVALGGLAAGLGGATDAKQALAYGFGAPTFVSKLLSSDKVEETSRRGPGELFVRLRQWWTF